MIFPRV